MGGKLKELSRLKELITHLDKAIHESKDAHEKRALTSLLSTITTAIDKLASDQIIKILIKHPEFMENDNKNLKKFCNALETDEIHFESKNDYDAFYSGPPSFKPKSGI